MNSIDDRITSALSEDDKAFLESLEGERGMFRQIGDSLGGPLGGWAKLMFAVSFVLGIFIAIAAYNLFTVDGTRETILWAVGTLAGLIAQGFVKEWFFNRMNMITVLRELKRVQLEVALMKGG